MNFDFDKIKEEAETDISSVQNHKDLEVLRVKYLGRKGLMADMYAGLAQASKEDKPTLGKNVNLLKNTLTKLIDTQNEALKSITKKASLKDIDVTIPGVTAQVGHHHLLTQTIDEICDIFEKMGFSVQEGPEIETEYHNFDALNIPQDHPSRDGFDTFYVDRRDPDDKKRNMLLRSQTSPVQIRIMKEYKPPMAVVVPGKVYRPDAVDASHSFMFHQIEGLLVSEDIKFSDLKGLLEVFLKKLFSDDIKMRFRPHFFPFTEPSAEVDISWEG
ncbi:MAG: phenylalanyl-tRNA synthetase alpha chain, partial [Lysobacterales bacterium]